jgi:DNA-binding transcriptional LysR family regulator
VTFSLVEAPADALLAMVEEGRADFGLSVRPAPHQRLQYRRLRDDPFVLVCRRDDPLAAAARRPGRSSARAPAS